MKRLLSFLILLVAFLAGYYILAIWRGINLYQVNVSKERLLRAITVTPRNPDPFYRLGVLHQWDIQSYDLNESVKFLGKAIERNPLRQEYWISVGRILQMTGKDVSAERALENAIRAYPTSFQGRWITGNLFLQRGKVEKALPHFSYILLHYPEQSFLVYNVWYKVVGDSDITLQKLVPSNQPSLTRYLLYLYSIGDKATAKKAWEKRVSLDERISREESLRHIEFLISRSDLHEAYRVWMARLLEEGLSTPADANLITNSGFEKEKLLGGGFDWRMDKVAGAQISFDPSIAFEGKRSLKISFNGKENVDFQHVLQFVAMKPNTDYLLHAHVRTKAVTTKSGVRIEILGIGTPFHIASEPLTGDHDWTEMTLTFRTPPQLQGGMLRLRREKTDKFDRFISGTVWIDNVRLTENK